MYCMSCSDVVTGSCGMETLVENVDRSAVVLVFLSNRLKNSAACRSGMTHMTAHCTQHHTYKHTYLPMVVSFRSHKTLM